MPSEQPQQPQVPEEIKRALEGLKTDIQSTKIGAKVMEDPDVLKVLQLKQAGKKASVSEEVPPKEEDDDESDAKEPEDLESLTNREILALAERRAAKRVRDSARKQISKLEAQLEQVVGMLRNQQLETVNNQIAEAKKRYSDFDVFLPDMQVISQQNPGLNIDEVYYLAKRRKVGPSAEQRVQSERPTATATRPPEKHLVEGLKPGPRGNSELINAGISAVLERMGDKLR